MMKTTASSWDLYTVELQKFERKLEGLLETEKYAGDDRRLNRVYVGIAECLADRMDERQKEYLRYVLQYVETGVFPADLVGVSESLGRDAQQVAAKEAAVNIQSDQQFILRLLESCTRVRFKIHPQTDVEPVAWAAAAGVPLSKIISIVQSQYPEMS